LLTRAEIRKGLITPTLLEENNVFVLDLGEDENRFSPDWIKAIVELLDTVAGTGASVARMPARSGWSTRPRPKPKSAAGQRKSRAP
jgi:hypothetical protein